MIINTIIIVVLKFNLKRFKWPILVYNVCMISFNENDYDLEIKGVDDSLQSLCLRCGKCCKLVVLDRNRIALQSTSDVDKEAKFWFDNLLPFETKESACSFAPEYFNQLINVSEQYFYACKCLSNKNLCLCYSDRPSRCKQFPSYPWEKLPEGCGFKGWQFEQIEFYKKKIRKLKEILYELEFYDENDIVTKDSLTAEELRRIILKKIEPFTKFGSDFW